MRETDVQIGNPGLLAFNGWCIIRAVFEGSGIPTDRQEKQ